MTTIKQDPRSPESYSHRVLIIPTGLSPQVVTETVYALACPASEVGPSPVPWVPTEIHLITTTTGAKKAYDLLLAPQTGWFYQLCRDYALTDIAFSESNIHVVTDSNQQPLEDIRSNDDNERVADFVTGMLREMTIDPDAALHVSIAGGRKTMGVYTHYALSLYGREQDRISHVLVSEPFESNENFFYPTPYDQDIRARNGKVINARDGRITLAQIPFVNLRHGIDDRLLHGDATFSQVVAAAKIALQPPSLVLDMGNRRVNAGGTIIQLSPASIAMLAVFARRCQMGESAISAPPKRVEGIEGGWQPDQAWRDRFLDEYRAAHHEFDDIEKTEKVLEAGMDGDQFSRYLSRLHLQLKELLGRVTSQPYLIDDGGSRPRTYALNLTPDRVHFEEIN